MVPTWEEDNACREKEMPKEENWGKWEEKEKVKENIILEDTKVVEKEENEEREKRVDGKADLLEFVWKFVILYYYLWFLGEYFCVVWNAWTCILDVQICILGVHIRMDYLDIIRNCLTLFRHY